MSTSTNSRKINTFLFAAVFVAVTTTLAGCGEDDENSLSLGSDAEIEFATPTGVEAQGSGVVAVTDVRKGSIDDLKDGGFTLDPDEEQTTPYYVDVAFENSGDRPVNLHDPGLEDADGNVITSLTVIDFGGSDVFEPCPALPATLAPGGSVEGCAIVLVPEDIEVRRAYFLPSGGSEFLYWETGL